MNLSAPDYKKIYKLQEKVIQIIAPVIEKFYLTGGTALGRFYLNHRYSDDLDFFVNESDSFTKDVENIFNLLKINFNIDKSNTLFRDSFIRITLLDEVSLKLEFVNDVTYYWGQPHKSSLNILVDNAGNILSNKLTAMLSRDEAKDVFDIITLSERYSFNWNEIYKQAFEKQVMNEQDIALRFTTFPVVWFEEKPWLKNPVNIADMKTKLEIIADDFLFARDNSLGVGKEYILDAKINTPIHE